MKAHEFKFRESVLEWPYSLPGGRESPPFAMYYKFLVWASENWVSVEASPSMISYLTAV